MKRLYFLFILILSTSIHPSEHNQSEHPQPGDMKRRASLPFLEIIRKSSFSSKNKGPMRKRSLSGEKTLRQMQVTNSSLPSLGVLQTIELKPDPTINVSPAEQERLYGDAKNWLTQSEQTADLPEKKRLIMKSEINLEILRRCGHKKGIEMLVKEIYARDFDSHLQSEIEVLNESLLEYFPADQTLHQLLYSLRKHRLETLADKNRFHRLKGIFLSLIGIHLSESAADKKKAQEFKKEIEALYSKKKDDAKLLKLKAAQHKIGGLLPHDITQAQLLEKKAQEIESTFCIMTNA